MRIDGDVLVLGQGGDLGLAFPRVPLTANFTLACDFAIGSPDANSGVFVGSWDPQRDVPDRIDPTVKHSYGNQAYVPVTTGFEVQIDELARGNSQTGTPDGLDSSRTGAIYAMPIGSGPGEQTYQRGPALEPGRWYHLEITGAGNEFTVTINGMQTSRFVNNDPYRGRASAPGTGLHAGFIGFQAHTGTVEFANICATGVAVPPAPPPTPAPEAQ
jgi:hypothetical protein